MMEGTWGFTSWNDVTSDIVEGEMATFYYIPSGPEPHWAGNAQRIEVRFFRAGRVASDRDRSANVYVEFVPRGGRKPRKGVQRSRPSLVIFEGWEHPVPPSGWMSDGSGVKAKWHMFAPEWRAEMDAFLSVYLREHPGIRILADFREASEPSSSERVPPNVEAEPVGPCARTAMRSFTPANHRTQLMKSESFSLSVAGEANIAGDAAIMLL
jgi:hypothetical protein